MTDPRAACKMRRGDAEKLREHEEEGISLRFSLCLRISAPGCALLNLWR
jgi:hypothetical protein